MSGCKCGFFEEEDFALGIALVCFMGDVNEDLSSLKLLCASCLALPVIVTLRCRWGALGPEIDRKGSRAFVGTTLLILISST